MSQLSQLKSEIENIAQQAKATGGNLTAFKSRFSQSISRVSAAIGGSAQRKDQEVIATLQQAQAKVDEAVSALEVAARTAQQYGQSL